MTIKKLAQKEKFASWVSIIIVGAGLIGSAAVFAHRVSILEEEQRKNRVIMEGIPEMRNDIQWIRYWLERYVE